ncbi:unnamed protein product [Peniophora sp. CBMAI 1063]|nr:unnamed protein product [Peniophora sp. CBMAI 1063]
MSDPPIVFKRTKSKATTRARTIEDPPPTATPQDAADVEPEPSPAALAAKVKNKAKQRNKPKKNLSFGADEEEGDGEAFKIKKSALSKKLSLGQHPATTQPPSNLNQASISDSRPVYDAKYLSELRASTSSRPRPVQDEDVTMSIDPLDGLTEEDASMIPLGKMARSLSSPAYDVDSELSLLLAEPADETLIPTETSIKDAKEKRERLRKTGAQPGGEDFISLSVTKRAEEWQGPHPESRLMREDDDLGEGDDEFSEFTSAQERIALGKKAKKVEASKRREVMSEMIADVEDDEETQEWELKQRQRGGFTTAGEDRATPAKPVYKPAPIPPPTPIPTLDAAMSRLSQTMSALTTSHAQNTSTLTSLSDEQTRLEQREAELRDIVARAEEKRSWFASFREWMENVATFLDEKYPRLEKVEEEYLSILRERRDMVAQRRRTDDADDLTAFLGALPVAAHTEPEELDELGRIIPKANPAAARRDRREARAARRTKRQQAPNRRVENDEGYSTDASLPPSDASDYRAAMASLAEKRDDILADVRADEFRDPSKGLSKWFGEWREKYRDVYAGAWGGLGLVGAWEFWVRLEIVGWSPFDSSKGLDDFKWYAQLHEYSQAGASPSDESENVDGGDLATSMITTAVIPRIAKVIENGGFDPWSARHVRRAAELAEELEMSMSKMDLKFQMYLKAIVSVFQTAVEDTITSQHAHLDLNESQFNTDAIPARRRLLAHHRKLVANILRWRKYSGPLFGVDQLLERLVGEAMLPVAESGWDVGGEEAMRETSKLFPAGAVPASLRDRLQ